MGTKFCAHMDMGTGRVSLFIPSNQQSQYMQLKDEEAKQPSPVSDKVNWILNYPIDAGNWV